MKRKKQRQRFALAQNELTFFPSRPLCGRSDRTAVGLGWRAKSRREALSWRRLGRDGKRGQQGFAQFPPKHFSQKIAGKIGRADLNDLRPLLSRQLLPHKGVELAAVGHPSTL